MLSFGKIYNLACLCVGYVLSLVLRKPVMLGLPAFLSVEPVSFCNLRCPECPSGNGSLTRRRGQISAETFDRVIEQSVPCLACLTLYFQGEPYLHPRFTEMVRTAHTHRIYTVTSTNGHFLSAENVEKTVRSGLDRLIVSVDGTTQEVYEKYRAGGNLSEVLQGIERLVACKKRLKSATPFVEMQFLVLQHNEHQISDIKRLAAQLGVNRLSLKTAQIYDFKNGSPLLPSIKKYARYVRTAQGTFRRKRKIRNRCYRAFFGAVIAADGTVLPCAYDKNGAHSFGNINEKSLAEIWQDDEAQRFRRQILTDRKVFDICCNCTE